MMTQHAIMSPVGADPDDVDEPKSFSKGGGVVVLLDVIVEGSAHDEGSNRDKKSRDTTNQQVVPLEDSKLRWHEHVKSEQLPFKHCFTTEDVVRRTSKFGFD